MPPPPKRVAVAVHIPCVVPTRHDPVLHPEAVFRTARKVCADMKKNKVQGALVDAVKSLQHSSQVASEHWYMWCCKYGKQNASGTPKLDPQGYEVDMLSGFLTYWCDQISKPVLIKAAAVTSLPDVNTQTEEPAGDLPAPSVSAPSVSATSA